MKKRTCYVLVGSVLVATTALFAAEGAKSISAAKAKEHIGERATVCGKVASAHFASRTRGAPTFLNLDEPYPHQVFTVLIWGSDRSKFGAPETAYSGKDLCVTGTLRGYRGEGDSAEVSLREAQFAFVTDSGLPAEVRKEYTPPSIQEYS